MPYFSWYIVRRCDFILLRNMLWNMIFFSEQKLRTYQLKCNDPLFLSIPLQKQATTNFPWSWPFESFLKSQSHWVFFFFLNSLNRLNYEQNVIQYNENDHLLNHCYQPVFNSHSLNFANVYLFTAVLLNWLAYGWQFGES